MLDLRRQAGWPSALAPLVQVGVSPVGDDDERQHVSQTRDRRYGRVVGALGHRQFQDPDGLPALGHRCQHQPLPATVGRRTLRARTHDLYLLGADRLLRRSAVERQDGRRLLGGSTLVWRWPSVGGGPARGGQLGVRHAHQGPAGQISDEEGDLRRAEHPAELPGDGFDRLHRGGRVCGVKDAVSDM